MKRLVPLILGSALALAAGPARAQLAPVEGAPPPPPPGAGSAGDGADDGPDAIVERPLLQDKNNFGAELYLRTTTGENLGVDRSLFRFLYMGVQGRGGGGKSDFAFGLEMLLSGPEDDDTEPLDRAWISMRAAAGQSGALRLTLVAHNPTDDRIVRRGVIDFGFDFKRPVADKVSVLFGGGGDFVYGLLPDALAADFDDTMDMRFYLHGGGQVQITPVIAAETEVAAFIPLVHRPNDSVTPEPDTSVRFYFRAYYTLTPALDAYVHIATFGEDDLRTSNGESASWMAGVSGRL